MSRIRHAICALLAASATRVELARRGSVLFARLGGGGGGGAREALLLLLLLLALLALLGGGREERVQL